MVVDTFFYMYIVGAGTAAGIASIVFVSYKIYQRMQNPKKKKKIGGIR